METPKNRNWKVLKSEYLSRQPWFTVRKEEVELPNGNRIPEYYIFEYPEWINVIAITKEQKFVFVSQYRHGLGITAYELCAGVCEKEDASPLISAHREELLLDDRIKQALHVAPLWKYMAMNHLI